ncbi:MAG: ERCC4 domain-containing protein [Nitrososphaeria archaeon]
MGYIIVDHRESKSSIPDLLKSMNINFVFKLLEVGDYIINPETAVERKSMKDFIASLFDGRLFNQIEQLSSSYPNAFIIVEGNFNEVEAYLRNPKAVYCAIASLLINYKIKLVNVLSEKETALFLYCLVNASTKKGRGYLIKHAKKKGFFDQQIYLISSLPSVGPKLALNLLNHFGSPKNVFLASVEELSKVPGIGLKRARRIRDLIDTNVKMYENMFEKLSK